MAEIINEIPDELDMKGEELEVDLDEGKKTQPEKSTSDVERVEQEPKQEELVCRGRRRYPCLKIEAKNHYLKKW